MQIWSSCVSKKATCGSPLTVQNDKREEEEKKKHKKHGKEHEKRHEEKKNKKHGKEHEKREKDEKKHKKHGKEHEKREPKDEKKHKKHGKEHEKREKDEKKHKKHGKEHEKRHDEKKHKKHGKEHEKSKSRFNLLAAYIRIEIFRRLQVWGLSFRGLSAVDLLFEFAECEWQPGIWKILPRSWREYRLSLWTLVIHSFYTPSLYTQFCEGLSQIIYRYW